MEKPPHHFRIKSVLSSSVDAKLPFFKGNPYDGATVNDKYFTGLYSNLTDAVPLSTYVDALE